jgi:hypothetical protein
VDSVKHTSKMMSLITVSHNVAELCFFLFLGRIFFNWGPSQMLSYTAHFCDLYKPTTLFRIATFMCMWGLELKSVLIGFISFIGHSRRFIVQKNEFCKISLRYCRYFKLHLHPIQERVLIEGPRFRVLYLTPRYPLRSVEFFHVELNDMLQP